MSPECPKSVYIHVPFCGRKCGYCNFTLVAGRDDLIDGYLDALELELQMTLSRPQQVDTIFLGGGTPSHLQGPALERLVGLIHGWFELSAGGEFSCEVNPLDCREQQLDALQAASVNRISIGGQSFDNAKLAMLERDHTADSLHQAIADCSERFSNISLDLIFASPSETLDAWQEDVRAADNSPIQHLSTYGLTVERGSAFYGRVAKKMLHEVDEDTQLAMYEHVIDQLTTGGWEHYEVSSFARRGHRCRHNENYWFGNPWWAFGPGAASYLAGETPQPPTDQPKQPMYRNVNHRSTTAYIRRLLAGRSPVAEQETVSPVQQLRERLVFGLRRLEGVDLDSLDHWWGEPVLPQFQPTINQFIDSGWLQLTGTRLQLTRRGLVISDGLWPSLL